MQRDKDHLKCLDELIADLGGADTGTQSKGPCGLLLEHMLLEHLQAARRDLLGSMPAEYSLSLQQARESVACIPDKSARTKTKRILRSLIDSEVPKQRRSMAASAGYALLSPAPAAPAL
jgi:hypothetical protein